MRRWRDNADAPSHVNATRKVALGITSRRTAMVVDGLLERLGVSPRKMTK